MAKGVKRYSYPKRKALIVRNAPPTTWRNSAHQNAVLSVRHEIAPISHLVKTVRGPRYGTVPRFGQGAPNTVRGLHPSPRARHPRPKRS